jgi:membrane protease YdiL (CAAX protease family)
MAAPDRDRHRRPMRLTVPFDASAPAEERRASATRAVVVLAVAAMVVVIHDGLVRSGVSGLGTLATNGVFVVALLSVARWAGLRREDLGLVRWRSRRVPLAGRAVGLESDRGRARVAGAGRRRAIAAAPSIVAALIALAIILIAAALLAAAVVVVAHAPLDAGVASLSWSEILFRALVGIPIGTALCEEVIFRGVLLAAFDRLLAPRWSIAATSFAFGLWHMAAESQRVGAGSTFAVVPGVLATTAASAFVLGPLRRRTGNLVAPIAVHAATNVAVFLAVVLATRPLG